MMLNNQLSTEFRTVVKGKNFMTPTISGYWAVADYVIELSRGTDFDGNKIYGVTVVNRVTKGTENELSKMVSSLAEAKAYMKYLEKTAVTA